MNSASGASRIFNQDLFTENYKIQTSNPVQVFFDSEINYDNLELAYKILLSHKIRIQYTYNKLSSLSNSRTRLLAHQIEATHKVITSLKPRFLIADEVGLGKTIEAGLILKELILRKNYKNIIIVVPATLNIQWKEELKNKFNENFIIINNRNFDILTKNQLENHKIITSIDFIKNPKYHNDLLKIKWDFAIFDEAHRLRRDYSKITQSYKFAEILSREVDGLLLLSATPFRGKIEELYFLIRLLDQHLLGPEFAFFNEYVIPSRNGESIKKIKDRISNIVIRRRKIEVGGFTRRIAKTIRFELSPEERLFYDQTTEYVKKEYNLSRQTQNRAIGFIMIVFQKLLDSSTQALLKALEKRKITLESKLFYTQQTIKENHYDIDEDIEYNENEIEILEHLEDLEKPQTIENIFEIRKEILTLSQLIQLGKKIKVDTKLIKLKEIIQKLIQKNHKKIVIFTQFRTTQDYLVEELKEYKTNIFHGSLSAEQKEKEIAEFKEKGEILICTEAGGEGRNMQFSDVLINYDLPWSPLKMEQRIGRIHRFGQKNDVIIINFATRNTVAERVLNILENKIRIFEESIGPSDIMLGSIEEDGNFTQLIMDLVAERISKKEFEVNIEQKLENAKKSYKLLNELFVPNLLDFNLIDYYKITQKERIIDNMDLEKITLAYLKDNKKANFSLQKIKTISSGKSKKTNVYKIQPANIPAIFDAEFALDNEHYSFLAIGHPVVDEALNYYLNHLTKKCIFKIKSQVVEKGIYFIFIIHFSSKIEKKEIITVKANSKNYTLLKNFDLNDLLKKKKQYELVKISKKEIDLLKQKAYNVAQWLSNKIEAEELDWLKGMEEIYADEKLKLESSYYTKIRRLEEKKDIEKLRYKMNPSTERKSVLTRTENAILNAKKELEEQIRILKNQTAVNIEFELLQIYWIINSV